MTIRIPQNFYRQTITRAVTLTGATNIYVSALPTPAEGYITISPASTTLREIVYYTAKGTDGNGNYITITLANRGLGGTTAQTHAIGEPVRMNVGAETIQEISDAIDQIVAAGAQDASTTTKGIAKMSVTPVSASNPIAVGDNDGRLVLTGMIVPYAGTSAPTNWLLCNGSAVSRSTYSALFAVVSTTYGVGDGSTTFNLPNLINRTPIGVGTLTKVATFASRSSNVITVTGITDASNNEFQTGQAVFYASTGSVMTGLTDDTTYYIVRVTNTTFSLASTLADAQNGTVISLSSDGSGTQTFTLTMTARTLGDTGGEENHAMSSSELLSHDHAGRHTGGSVSGPSGSASTYSSITRTGLTGGNAAMNNMQPFLGINYIIKT